MKRLLLVEDDQTLGAALHERLEKSGYQVQWFETKAQVLSNIEKNHYDLIILDVGLPDGSGFDLALELRKRVNVPYIFLTAQFTAEDRLRGYDLGAEDFIPKPFHLRELLLRVQHVLEKHVSPKIVSVAGCEVHFGSRVIKNKSGQVEYLTSKDFSILRLLIESSPKVLSRDEILAAVWGEDKFPSNRTIDNAIVRIRQMLDDHEGLVIRSVRGVGYQWLEPVQEK